MNLSSLNMLFLALPGCKFGSAPINKTYLWLPDLGVLQGMVARKTGSHSFKSFRGWFCDPMGSHLRGKGVGGA